MGPDFYAILGVAPESDADQITRAFRHLVRVLHPDATDGPHEEDEEDQGTAERLRQVLAAWHVLHDPEARAAYDRTRAAPAPTAGPGSASGEGHSEQPAEPVVVQDRRAYRAEPYIRFGPTIRLDE
jgi:curved DNA-binding protein CbpA